MMYFIRVPSSLALFRLTSDGFTRACCLITALMYPTAGVSVSRMFCMSSFQFLSMYCKKDANMVI